MVSRWWGPFGIPATMTTDQGSQFIGSWWRTVCSRLGARHVFSQAYHHAANGRAEVAGRNLQDLLKSLCVEQLPRGHTWVDLLPIALRQLHDLPGPMGLSPYQIVFGGRTRSAGAIPIRYPQERHDARDWIEHHQEMDKLVSARLNQLHERQAQARNQTRPERPTYSPGDRVWVLRPKPDKTHSRWIGPDRKSVV